MVWIIFQVPRYHFIAERLLVGDSAVPARVHPKYPFNFCATAFATALSSRPARRSIRAGSMQAIFAVRTTDGAGRPARARSTIVPNAPTFPARAEVSHEITIRHRPSRPPRMSIPKTLQTDRRRLRSPCRAGCRRRLRDSARYRQA